jgi:integrase
MPLKIYKRGEVWHYRGTVAGRRLRGSTGASSKDIAQQIAAREESKAWKRDLHGPEAILTFADAAVLYRRAGKSTRYLEKIEDHFRDTLVKDIEPGTIRQAAIDLYPNAAAATRNRQVIVPAAAIINHAAEFKYCTHIRVKRFKVEKKEKTPVTWEWVETFAAGNKPHLGALAMFMYLTGARISEAVRVTWDDINLHQRTVLIRQSKVGAERIAHLPPPLWLALANLPRDKRPFRYRQRSITEVWSNACDRAGVKRLSPHACRHGFATGMLRAGYDVVTVAKHGGWQSVRHVLETYGHAIEDGTITERLTGTPLTHPNGGMQKTPIKSR